MPNKDGTGPEGKGSKTGIGLGKCGKNDNSEVSPQRLGQGRGLRRRATN